jgi:hypothetical protein
MHFTRSNAAALRSGTRAAPGAEQHERLRAPSFSLLRGSYLRISLISPVSSPRKIDVANKEFKLPFSHTK